MSDHWFFSVFPRVTPWIVLYVCSDGARIPRQHRGNPPPCAIPRLKQFGAHLKPVSDIDLHFPKVLKLSLVVGTYLARAMLLCCWIENARFAILPMRRPKPGDWRSFANSRARRKGGEGQGGGGSLPSGTWANGFDSGSAVTVKAGREGGRGAPCQCPPSRVLPNLI